MDTGLLLRYSREYLHLYQIEFLAEIHWEDWSQVPFWVNAKHSLVRLHFYGFVVSGVKIQQHKFNTDAPSRCVIVPHPSN